MTPPSEDPPPSFPSPASGTGKGLFPHTQWSIISAARGADHSDAAAGLRNLAFGYWRPLYLYLRKRGESHENASDSVQGFFEFMLSSGFLDHVEREGGKFRSYLLRSLERWRSRQRVRDGAQKRGGQAIHVPLDEIDEFRNDPEMVDELSPEAAFDRRWAMEMIARVVLDLKGDYAMRGRAEWFDCLAPALPGGGELPAYADLAVAIGATEGAVKKAVFDLRSAFACRLKQEIRATVRTNEDAEEELRYLISVI